MSPKKKTGKIGIKSEKKPEKKEKTRGKERDGNHKVAPKKFTFRKKQSQSVRMFGVAGGHRQESQKNKGWQFRKKKRM